MAASFGTPGQHQPAHDTRHVHCGCDPPGSSTAPLPARCTSARTCTAYTAACWVAQLSACRYPWGLVQAAPSLGPRCTQPHSSAPLKTRQEQARSGLACSTQPVRLSSYQALPPPNSCSAAGSRTPQRAAAESPPRTRRAIHGATQRSCNRISAPPCACPAMHHGAHLVQQRRRRLALPALLQDAVVVTQHRGFEALRKPGVPLDVLQPRGEQPRPGWGRGARAKAPSMQLTQCWQLRHRQSGKLRSWWV